jgi:CMP-N-acetylneuraminic acid synthetase
MSPLRLLFLIPARGGSKSFPGKNLALLAGILLVGRAVPVQARQHSHKWAARRELLFAV